MNEDEAALIEKYGQRLCDAAMSGDEGALIREGERTIEEIGDLSFMAALAAMAGLGEGMRRLAGNNLCRKCGAKGWGQP